ncbi:MAG: hypothetical protein ABSG65_29725 [Bryobacteraceae bacterium]|jgi:predicted nucleic acid-binding protein
MILVVADTSPLRYLVEIGYEFLPPRLFDKVWIPGTVASELRHARTPTVVRRWAGQIPSWIEVRQVEGLLPRMNWRAWTAGCGVRGTQPKRATALLQAHTL